MQLYLLKPRKIISHNINPWSPWYDKAFGFVIRAENEEQARKIADENAGDENYGGEHPWLNSKQSTCVLLTNEGKQELVLRDFNAA